MLRIERLINLIIALLEARRPYTAEDIRTKVAGYGQPREAFRRTFERDKEDLRNMGIEIEAVQTDPFSEVPDGYVIRKEKFYLPALDLEADELAALRIAAEAVLGMGEQAGSGFVKLSVDSTPGSWSAPRVVWGADLAAEQPLLPGLYAAVLERSPLNFEYRAASGELLRRHVEPYALVHRRGHWYLVGRDVDRDAMRSFKVSRITSALEAVPGSYEIPAGFDVDEHVPSEAWEIGPAAPETAVVRFDPDMRWWAEHNMSRSRMMVTPDGSIDVEVPVANLDALVSWVLGFGSSVEIVSPPHARRRLVDHLAIFAGDRR